MPRRRAIRLARRDRALQPVYISRVGATVRTSTHRPRVCTSTPATSMRPAAGIWPRVRPHSRRSSRRTAAGKRSLASGAVARYSRARLARCLMRRTKVRAYGARTLYKARARIEQGVGRLKSFKRLALRCEKTARNFRSIVSFAAGLCSIKFVHMA
jgi:hypothetical protein